MPNCWIIPVYLSQTSIYTLFSLVIQVRISPFPQSFTYVYMFLLIHTNICMHICFSFVKHVCIPDFPQSYKYVYLLFLSHTLILYLLILIHTRMYICFSVIQVHISAFPLSYTYLFLIFLSFTSMFIYFSSVIQVCISALPQYVYLLFLKLTNIYNCTSWATQICICPLPEPYKYVNMYKYVLLLFWSRTKM